MRVLFWSLTFWPNIGGIETLAARLLPSLRKLGHEFLVVTPKNYTDLPDEDRYQDIRIHRLDFQNATPARVDELFRVRQKVIDLKRTFAPDLIHLNGVGATDFFHLTTRQAYEAPTLVTLHNPWLVEAESVIQQTLRAADWITGVSASILDRARRLTPEIAERCSIIHNAVAPPFPTPDLLPISPPRLLFLGRLAEDKGVDIAIDAFAHVITRLPNARLTIAGDGPLRRELEQHVGDRRIAHAVDFVGWVKPERVMSFLNDYALVLMPSRQEPFGLVALEAALMARPVIATRVGGLPEIVVHGQTGMLVEKDDSRALAHAAIQLLMEPSMAVQLGHAARQHALDKFAWRPHVDRYDTLYRQLARPAIS